MSEAIDTLPYEPVEDPWGVPLAQVDPARGELFRRDWVLGYFDRLRREDPVIVQQARGLIEGAVIGPSAFVLRYAGQEGNDRLLVINLGADCNYRPAPEPLLAPPDGRLWSLRWSSDAPEYGGPGVIEPLTETGWFLPSGSAALYAVRHETTDTTDSTG